MNGHGLQTATSISRFASSASTSLTSDLPDLCTCDRLRRSNLRLLSSLLIVSSSTLVIAQGPAQKM